MTSFRHLFVIFLLLGALVSVDMVIDILGFLAISEFAVVDVVVVLLLGSLGSVQALDTLPLEHLDALGLRLPVGLDIRLALGRIVVVPGWWNLLASLGSVQILDALLLKLLHVLG